MHMQRIALALLLAAGTTFAADAPKTLTPLDKADLDTSVNACTDFNQYANGGWLKNHPIPPAYSSWGVSNVLAEANREKLHAFLEAAAKSKAKPGSVDQKIGDYYTSCMDEAAVEKSGLAPIQPE